LLNLKKLKKNSSHILDEGNIDKSMSAPAVAIISYDVEFYENYLLSRMMMPGVGTQANPIKLHQLDL
jgi:hypothetical protein